MKKTLIINLEKDEIFWIKRIEEVYNLVPIHPPIGPDDYNPFSRIKANAFSADDVRLAQGLLTEAVEQKLSFYEHTNTDYAAGVIANCKRAVDQFGEFLDFLSENS